MQSKLKKQKFYAVKVGRHKGIYLTWDDCDAMVHDYKGAKYKSFYELQDAYNFLFDIPSVGESIVLDENVPYAFVDGSFNSETKTYGYGGFLVDGDKMYPIYGSGQAVFCTNNIDGELNGCMEAIKLAESLDINNLIIYYDFTGIGDWATGRWRTKKPATIAYKQFIDSPERKVKVIFKRVPAHKGILGNETADALAKKAAGIVITQKQQQLIEGIEGYGR